MRWLLLCCCCLLTSTVTAGELQLYRPRLSQPPQNLVPGPQAASSTQRYLILQPTQAAIGQGVHPSPYAYGWFGAAPRSHYESSRSYYGSPSVWKSR